MWPLPLKSIDAVKYKEATAPDSPITAATAAAAQTDSAVASATLATLSAESFKALQTHLASYEAAAAGTCPKAPSVKDTAAAPIPARDGPTFYRCATALPL